MTTLHRRKKRKKNNVQIYSLDDLVESEVEEVPTISNSESARVTRTVITTIRAHENIDPLCTNQIPFSPQSIDDLPASAPSDLGYLQVKTKAKRYQNSDAPLITWKEYRQEYLDACLALDGRGRFTYHCAECHMHDATYRCRDCFGNQLYCQSCLLKLHRCHPLHRIEIWNGMYFKATSLQKLGLHIQLGHSGLFCEFQIRGEKDFVIIDTYGIHQINISFCGCNGAPHPRQQLLEVGWWPSTPKDPQSAATMNVLRNFHTLNLQGQISPTDFYRSLERLTCGDGLSTIPDRLAQWMIIIREWRHIKMGKRAGRGHDPAGINSTSQGGLAVLCRTCPIPEINLPQDWKTESKDRQWLYTRILAEDANFKQKSRLRSGKSDLDPLGPGWGTFVSHEPYLNYVSQFANQNEISHCVGFAAMWSANTKKSKGLRATGIGAVSCARHEVYCPNGMGDLQFGERYCNMDYLFLSSIFDTSLTNIIASYDIACQWGKNFSHHAGDACVPPHLRPSSKTDMAFLVPKFHLEAHTTKCQAPFSFNYAVGVGRTDGEGVERNWSTLNGIASSVSVMGPGARWDTIDDFCNFANWRKTVELPSTLLRKLALAIPQSIIHHRAFTAFSESLRAEHEQEMGEWEDQVKKWEGNHGEYCPYNVPDQKITFADVKRQLSQEEHEKIVKGDSIINFEGLSPAEFIVAALNLENLQQEILIDAKTSHTTDQETSLQRKRTSLLVQIQEFIAARDIYLPGLSDYLQASGVNQMELPRLTPEIIPLYLPSSFPSEKRAAICIAGIDAIEDRLRFAQACEALVQLRMQLMKRTCASRYKSRNVDSQRSYTRFRTLQDHTESKIKSSQIKYTVARNAIFAIRGPGSWEDSLKVLHPEDVRGLGEHALRVEELETDRCMQKLAGLDASERYTLENICSLLTAPLPSTKFISGLAIGEGQRTLSWIWYSTTGEELERGETEAYLRVEWLRCRARAARWKEEVELLDEEMRRSIRFCEWKMTWWDSQKDQRTTVPSHIREGIVAYAAEQANAERQRATNWASHWADIRTRAAAVLKGCLTGNGDVTDRPLGLLQVEIEKEDSDLTD